jgi:hypothetical protein
MKRRRLGMFFYAWTLFAPQLLAPTSPTAKFFLDAGATNLN